MCWLVSQWGARLARACVRSAGWRCQWRRWLAHLIASRHTHSQAADVLCADWRCCYLSGWALGGTARHQGDVEVASDWVWVFTARRRRRSAKLLGARRVIATRVHAVRENTHSVEVAALQHVHCIQTWRTSALLQPRCGNLVLAPCFSRSTVLLKIMHLTSYWEIKVFDLILSIYLSI